MKYKLRIVNETKKSAIKAQDMRVGDIGRVLTGSYIGHIVLSTYSGLISLTNPQSTWTPGSSTWPSFFVELLPNGAIIELEIKEEEK